MIRVTLDTNVLASGATAVAGPIATVIDAWHRGDLAVVISSRIVAESERALHNPYFAQRLDSRARNVYLGLVRVRASINPITTPIPSVVSSYADNAVLATAQSADVDFLITGEAELLQLGAFQDISILSPRAFIDRMYW